MAKKGSIQKRSRSERASRASTAAQSPPAGPSPGAPNPYIVSAVFDSFFFIYSPLIAALLPFVIDYSDFWMTETDLGMEPQPRIGLFLGAFIYAHLALVVFRSHGNREIFGLFPVRFTVVPIALFVAMMGSVAIAVSVSVLTTWWDVYHSGLQTFGLGRIYDARKGNDPNTGRRLDYWLNLLLYMGPILAGATLMDHVEDFDEFKGVTTIFFTQIPAQASAYSQFLTYAIVSVGVPFLLYYLYAHWKMEQQGYHVSRQKVALYTCTGLVSIYAWGFNPFGHAFFVMNFFHALQYFAIVWSTDKKNIQRIFRLDNVEFGKPLTLLLFISLPFAFGFWGEAYAFSDASVILWNCIAIMHFWYDGFIWSVRKQQV